MVNASNLASAVGAAAGASAGVELGTASVHRTAIRRTATATSAQQTSGPGTLLLDFLARRELVAAAGGGIMKARARSAGVPGYAAASRSSSQATSSSTSSAAARAATSKAATSKSATSKSSSSLSFLSDARLSIEEKLMRLMAYLNDKYEKEMQAKMDEIAGKKTSSSSSTAKKSSSIFGRIAGAVSSVVGSGTLSAVNGFMKVPGVKTALKSVAGPVLAAGATALGFPEAAPVLLKYGSKVVDAVAGVASASSSAATSGTSSSGGTSSSSGADGKTDQLAMMEIQRLMDKQKEMFSLVSNILKAGHDTRMAAINNVR